MKISMRAYCKTLLHAVKYPHCAVNGLLLAEKPKNKDVKNILVTDAVPLFHVCLGLSPMLEVALLQVDHYCKTLGLVIAGYYQANEHYRDCNPDFFALRIADKIYENFSDAFMLMVENHKLSVECSESAVQLYQNVDGKWKVREKNSFHLEQDGKTLAAASALLQSKSYRDLIDFDAHLDDASQNWQNVHINDVISRLL